MRPAIRVDRLSKQYRIGARASEGYRTLRESLSTAVTAPLRRWRHHGETAADAATFWALKDVSFEVQPGEVVGVIGRNGAGKSTLLKTLSRIIEPTSGRATVRGRVCSLLEVGTGFHPELTGRENIYLNGSILGMSRKDITRKFDEIVAFSEVEQFLDTPVKRYSSGMYVRLAFAVASTLEPDILVVDEVLAVGDQQFQRKCLGKMTEMTQCDRTVLFVSHNMAAVQNLCSRVVLLDRGRLSYIGPCAQGISFYTRAADISEGGIVDVSSCDDRRTSGVPVLRQLRLLDGRGIATSQLTCGEQMALEFETDWQGPPTAVNFYFGVNDATGRRLFTAGTFLAPTGHINLADARRVTCTLADLPLAPGRYSIDVFVKPPHLPPIEQIEAALWFDVVSADFYGNGRQPDASLGTYIVRSRWTTAHN